MKIIYRKNPHSYIKLYNKKILIYQKYPNNVNLIVWVFYKPLGRSSFIMQAFTAVILKIAMQS